MADGQKGQKGHIRQRSKGSWLIEWDAPRGADGTRQHRSETVRGKKSDAQRRLNEILASIDESKYHEPTRITLAYFLAEYWLPSLKTTRSPTTREFYRHLIDNQIVPALGTTRLDQLKPADIQRFETGLLDSGRRDGTGGLAPQSVAHVHWTLSAALTWAKKKKLIPENPIRDVDPPSVPRHEMTVLDADQTRALLVAARGDVIEPAVLLGAAIGLRRGECLALRWTEADLESGRLSVRRSRYQVKGEVGVKGTKTGAGRLVVLPPFVLPELRRIKGEQAQRRLQLGSDYDGSGWLCCHEDGRPLRPDYVSHRFPKILRSAGLPRVPFHALRHGCATFLLEAGVHPKVVAEILGHSSTAVTLTIYSHVTAGLQVQAAEQLNRVLGG